MKKDKNEITGFAIETRRPLLPYKDKRVVRARMLIAICFAAVIALLYAFAARDAGFMAWWSGVMRVVLGTVAQFFSFTRYSVFEILAALAILLMLYALVRFIVRAVKTKPRRIPVLRFVSGALALVSFAYFVFYAMWGILYNAPPLKDRLNLDVRARPAEELLYTALFVQYGANLYSRTVPRSADGACDFGTFFDMADKTQNAYLEFFEAQPQFKTRYVPPTKHVRSGVLMSYFGITGIFFPVTGEGNASPDNIEVQLPFTMAHEMAHRLVISREDEANFFSFLVLSRSSDTDMRYSAYLMAYIYATNALNRINPELTQEVMAGETSELRADLNRIIAHFKKYENTPTKQIGEAVNDGYLHAMGQEAGIQSYGQMVDLLVAYVMSAE